MRPDEALVRAHLEGGPFRLGEAEGRWNSLGLAWPYLVVAVTAPVRPAAPTTYTFRFDLSNYPTSPPMVILWDPVQDQVLPDAKWPTGPAEGRPASIFRPDWARSHGGLYVALDRSGLTTHPDWLTTHAAEAWTPNRTFVDYLDLLYDLLASTDYTGPASPWPSDLM